MDPVFFIKYVWSHLKKKKNIVGVKCQLKLEEQKIQIL